MDRSLLKQTTVVPLGAMLVPMIWGFFVPGYSSINQQQSELQLLDHPIALAMRVFPVLTGLSLLAFALALLRSSPRMPFTAASVVIVAVSMVANGVFVTGNPLHGLYGLTIFCVLVPACFAAETPLRTQPFSAVVPSLVVSFATLIYMWLMISGLHPQEMRGLSQRIALVLIFGWYSYAALMMLRLMPSDPRAAANYSLKRTNQSLRD